MNLSVEASYAYAKTSDRVPAGGKAGLNHRRRKFWTWQTRVAYEF